MEAANKRNEQRRETFRKEERLRLRTLVERLFAEGKNIYEFPLRLTWRIVKEGEMEEMFCHGVPEGIGKMQLLFTIPKKKRRKAVDRVLMRRRLREAYRLNRLPLKEKVESDGGIRSLEMAFIYLKDENCDYAEIEEKMQRLLERLARKIKGKGE